VILSALCSGLGISRCAPFWANEAKVIENIAVIINSFFMVFSFKVLLKFQLDWAVPGNFAFFFADFNG
jgi:hypothetical protein